MKYNKLYHMVAALLVVMLLVLTACGSEPRQPQTPNETTVTGPEEIGEIYLYGENTMPMSICCKRSWPCGRTAMPVGCAIFLWSCPIIPPSTLTCGCRRRMIPFC